MKRWLEKIWGDVEDGDRQLIQIFAGSALYMEGCDKVLHCDTETICLKGVQRITVIGKGLLLKELGNNNVCAQGQIDQILFER